MLEPGGEADLPLEPLGPHGGGELGVEDLEGDGPVVAEIPREIHGGHAAPPELALDGVAVGERGLERGAGVGGHEVPSTSRWNRGCFRMGSKLGSMRSQPGERL